jgi:hypothetical protein
VPTLLCAVGCLDTTEAVNYCLFRWNVSADLRIATVDFASDHIALMKNGGCAFDCMALDDPDLPTFPVSFRGAQRVFRDARDVLAVEDAGYSIPSSESACRAVDSPLKCRGHCVPGQACCG